MANEQEMFKKIIKFYRDMFCVFLMPYGAFILDEHIGSRTRHLQPQEGL